MSHITRAPEGRARHDLDRAIRSIRKLGGLDGPVDAGCEYHAQDGGATPEQLRQQGFVPAPEVQAHKPSLRGAVIWKRPTGMANRAKSSSRLGI